MSKIIFLALVLFIQLSSSGQNSHLTYYSAIDSAQQSMKVKEYSLAIEQYEKARNELGFLPTTSLNQALKAAKKTKNEDLENKYDELIEEQKNSIDESYQSFIDSLYQLDQEVRNGKSIKAVRYVDMAKALPHSQVDSTKLIEGQLIVENWQKTDSLNTKALIKAINEKGFPSEARVGPKGLNQAITILIHFGLIPTEANFHSILKEALYKGELPPFYYAYIIDCQRVRFSEKQLYCQYLPYFFERLTEEEKQIVVQNRHGIGLYKGSYTYGGKTMEIR
ncbi:MAG: hypothetical protein MI810_07550 [Flavobacteriales bacterium]|nr:hypothetical protein [Flavobacteriales bacterium]